MDVVVPKLCFKPDVDEYLKKSLREVQVKYHVSNDLVCFLYFFLHVVTKLIFLGSTVE